MDIDFTSYRALFRVAVTIAILVAWYKIGVRTPLRWQHMTRLGKRLWLWYYAILFAVAYATLEALKDDTPLSSRNYVLAFAVLGLMCAALLHLSGDESTEPVWKIHSSKNPLNWRLEKLR